MKTIYLMRHGETLFNTMELNQGQCDSPLTPNGIAQAQCAKAWFKAHQVQFDAVHCSSLGRACDTAQIVSNGMPAQRHKGLREIYLGTREASPISINPPYPYGDYFVPFGGEDLTAFTDRIYDTIFDIADNDPSPVLLIVSHGMAIRRFLTRLPGGEAYDNGYIGNCGIVKLEFQDGAFRIIQIINPCN